MTNTNKTVFENLTHEKLNQFIAEKFPNKQFTFELFTECYNVETIENENDEKYELTSIQFYVEIEFENETETEFVEFELKFNENNVFDDEIELDEFTDEIAIKLNHAE